MAIPKIDMSKRKQAEKLVYDYFDIADPSGRNTARYKKMFSEMSDAKFKQFMTQMFEDDNMNYILDIEDYKSDISVESAERCLNFLGVPVAEYIIMPHMNMDLVNPTVTKYRMITGYIIDIRMVQTNHKKNSTSIHISQRSAVTGQVVGDDKNGRSTDQENIALVTYGATNILKELNGFRSDGMGRKNEAYADISNTGVCSVEKVERNHGLEDRTALNVLDMYYTCMCLKTDLITPGYIFLQTARNGGAKDNI